MKKLNYLSIIVMIALFTTGCTEDLVEELKPDPVEEKIEASLTDHFVTKELAIEIANTFFDVHASRSGLKSSVATHSKALVETVKEDQNNNPIMYIINYPEGGWAIVSATKSYYPVLAYSDENAFVYTSDMGPVDVWLTETKDAIKTSETLPDSTKMMISNMWNDYTMNNELDPVISNFKSADPRQDALSLRISQLTSRYGAGSAYRYTTLAGARSYFPSEADWQSVCNWSNAQGSPPQYTIFVGRNVYSSPSVGPLLKTHWHQKAPFNDLVALARPVGCAAIAVAQVMKYYNYPQSFNFGGNLYNMSAIHESWTIGSIPHAALGKYVGEALGTNYMTFASWTTPGSMESGIRSLGFTVTRRSHDYNYVRSQLLTFQKPVIMLGGSLDLFDPVTYVGESHFWVCDGAKEFDHDLVYFIELINTSNNTYYMHPYIYNTSNPFTNHLSYVLHFYMNWGWNGDYDGWFLNLTTYDGKFKYGRQDYYITKP